MDFLKAILGEELFTQLSEKLNAYNGDEANKYKKVKLANLETGEYVGKGKYDSLSDLLKGKETELANANTLISDLKKASKGNEDLQGKITTYEQENQKLQKELADVKLGGAIKVALLSAKAEDVDYLTFKLTEKLKEKGETLELDENDNIKGWDDKLSGLKTQFPKMFGDGGDGGTVYKPVSIPNGGNGGNGLTKADLLKKSYAERNRIYNENPEAYKAAMNAE